MSESHLKNESKWYLFTAGLSVYSHLVDHAAHGDLAPKWAENLKFSSPPKGANVGQRPPPRVDGAASGNLLPLYIVCARIKHAWRVACDPLRVFPNTYAIWKGIFLHILDYFTPYMAHIMTLVPTDSKIGTFWSSYNFEVWANSLGNPLNLSYRRVQVSILERIPNPYTLSAVNRTPGMVPNMAPLFKRPTSGHCTSAGNQPQIKSGGVLESSALALQDCTISQMRISYPCEWVPLKKWVSVP